MNVYIFRVFFCYIINQEGYLRDYLASIIFLKDNYSTINKQRNIILM